MKTPPPMMMTMNQSLKTGLRSATGKSIKKVRVTKAGQEVSLTRKEFQLLAFLADHQGQVLSREQLLDGVWGYDILGSSRIVDIHVSHLRDKLEDDSQKPVHLTTVRGFGYKLE